MDWKDHIHDVCLRLRRYIGIFYKLSFKLSPQLLKILYFSIVYPHILYGIEVYANNFASHLHDLSILNNRILRIIQHSKAHYSTLDLYFNYNTLPIDKLFKMQILILAHSTFYKNATLPPIFLLDRQTNSDVHNYSTRTRMDFHRSSITSTYDSKTSSKLISKYWNLLPSYLKSVSSPLIFKKLIKSFLQSNLSSF